MAHDLLLPNPYLIILQDLSSCPILRYVTYTVESASLNNLKINLFVLNLK